MKLQLKKETKRTCVYETDNLTAAVEQVYVSKRWISAQRAGELGRSAADWPQEIELEVKVLS